MKLLFVGESWRGSCARSLREALSRNGSVQVDDLAEDAYFPRLHNRLLRGVRRTFESVYRRELDGAILSRVATTHPQIFVAYKGWPLHAHLVRQLKERGCFTVNVYPDCSPHAYGEEHRRAVGEYDLVISTKQFHPRLWKDVYGYTNRCEVVPQGYDPSLHLFDFPPEGFQFDVVMVATYRPEYGRLIRNVARGLAGTAVKVAIGGNGWDAERSHLPPNWRFYGEVSGSAYVELLRAAKVCIAPVTREIEVNGNAQPGDVDTTRSYELAAAFCFFVHRRTAFIETIYDPQHEVPMFDDVDELVRHIQYYLIHEKERRAMATRAHERAVPAYSTDARASAVLEILRRELAQRGVKAS